MSTSRIQSRMLTNGNQSGFAPGVGAGFLLLTTDNTLQETCIATLDPPSLANEAGHRFSDAPYLGEGLAEAIHNSARSGLSNHIKRVYSSHNGEQFGNKEYGVAMLRNQAALDEHYSHEHPADCFGDIGAAFAPVLIALAANNAKQQNSLIYCASDQEYRGAIMVRA